MIATRRNRKFQSTIVKPIDLEKSLVAQISNTGKEEIKERKKAGLSVYYLKGGRVVEVRPDKTEIAGKEVKSKWVTLEKEKRKIVLK